MSSRTWTNEQLFEAVKTSVCIAEVLRKLNLVPAAGNYKQFHKYIKEFHLDISHFLGRAHLKGRSHEHAQFKLEDILTKNSTYNHRHTLKSRLLKKGLLKYQCYTCGINEWKGQKLELHLDHINGVNNDNRLENLRLLCPNCHSCTDTYCARKLIKREYKHCKSCQLLFLTIPSSKQECCSKSCAAKIKNIKYRKVLNRPTKDEINNLLETHSFLAVGRIYGVSDNTIRKWLK